MRIWAHKVWSNVDDALCASGPDYVFKNVQVRVPNPSSGYHTSPTGLNLRTDNCNQSEWIAYNPLEGCVYRQVPGAITHATGITSPMTVDANGVLVFDGTYASSKVPNSFDYIIGEAFENDCGNEWNYETSCGFLGLESDDSRVTGSWIGATNSFRGAPPGTLQFVQSDGYESTGEFNAYYLLVAFQWDWIDPLPNLPSAATAPAGCTGGNPNYQDGPIQLQVEFMGIWSDSDFDGGAFCVGGLFGDEDIRVKHRTWDNISA
ncbi:MAG: hypothetical protein NZ108_07235, partial [Bacteroidia bacterium]|nr:hypothetical protein [Bacteroidia bacterium]